MTHKTRIKVVIFNHNQKKSAEDLYRQLRTQFDIALMDSGSDAEQISEHTTHQFENLFWTGCWNRSWELFENYDVIWGIGGDCELLSSPEEYRNAIETASPYGLWSPVVSGHSHDYMQPDLAAQRVLSVQFLEGIAFAISKDLWTECGPLDLCNFIGWGYDLMLAHYSRRAGSRNILDGRVELLHPPSSQYNFDEADRLMDIGLAKAFGPNYCDIIDWWRDRRISFSANAVSEMTQRGSEWVLTSPFKRK